MASGKKCPEPIQVKLEFGGILSSALRPKLISEIVKLLLYQRQQIPVTYRDIKTEVAHVQVMVMLSDNAVIYILPVNFGPKIDIIKIQNNGGSLVVHCGWVQG